MRSFLRCGQFIVTEQARPKIVSHNKIIVGLITEISRAHVQKSVVVKYAVYLTTLYHLMNIKSTIFAVYYLV